MGKEAKEKGHDHKKKDKRMTIVAMDKEEEDHMWETMNARGCKRLKRGTREGDRRRMKICVGRGVCQEYEILQEEKGFVHHYPFLNMFQL